MNDNTNKVIAVMVIGGVLGRLIGDILWEVIQRLIEGGSKAA